MSYSYPLALPTNTGLSSLVVTPMSFVAVTESPWTGYQETQANQGQRWQFDVVLPIMKRADAALWESFFLKLNGRQYTFLLGHTGEATPRGVATGTPLVNGGSQTGQALVTDGWAHGVTGILKAGDWVQLGAGASSRLYRNLDDVNSDGSGNATLNLWPLITTGNTPADNAAIVVNSTQGAFRLMDDNVPFNVDTALLYNYKFKAGSIV